MTLISCKPYRRLKTFLGYRSFMKESQAGRPNCYALIRGNPEGMETLASELIGMGYKEEWAKDPRHSGHWE